LKKNNKILLIGGSGDLGSAIIKSELFENLYSPVKKKFNLTSIKSIRKVLNIHKFNLVINCAAMARILDCERNPTKAINVNIGGTLNLVKEILRYEINHKRKIKLIHISSDGVYPSLKGNYFETGPLGPYNIYGWTKLASEFVVKLMNRHVIIRTRFFDKKKIKFRKSAKDIFTSNIEINDLVKAIKTISLKNFTGVINVGSKRHSDYVAYKKFNNNLKPCRRKDIIKNLNVNLAKDSSMNLSLFNKVKKNI
jgi:dTDP-4-dehydrorhamnose reductase|tara:strand:+ start:19 stop:774 length:756 start_codon:yes stop_codon:yes gene_type:complete